VTQEEAAFQEEEEAGLQAAATAGLEAEDMSGAEAVAFGSRSGLATPPPIQTLHDATRHH
jgi:hypothetical protein